MPTSPLIVALDLPDRQGALNIARLLRPHVAMVKVGLEGYVGHGPDLVRALRDEGLEVFLDLKLHDIPRTAAAAARAAAGLGVRLLTVHAAGGAEMVTAVREAMPAQTQVVAVTALTSLDAAALQSLGVVEHVADWAKRLGALALHAGADGLVCSAHELAILQPLGGVRVVPGVRPATHGDPDDQKRVATPSEAVRMGATWIVVGRPILQATDPEAAARAINREATGASRRARGQP